MPTVSTSRSPGPWLPKPTLTGERVVLRPFRGDDVVPMAAILADPEVGRLTGSVHHSDERGESGEVTGELWDWYGSRAEVDDRLDLAVVDRATDDVVGEVVINNVDDDNLSANFRILLGPAGRDRGLGTEATRLIVDHALTVLGLHRLSLEVYAFNPRARRVYEKAGFRSEGVLRDALLFDGQWIDAEVMAILRPD